MKIVTDSKIFANLLATLSPAVGDNSDRPIFNSVQLDVSQAEKKMTLTAFNGDLGLRLSKLMPVEGNSTYCLTHKDLLGLSQSIQDPELQITDYDPRPKSKETSGMDLWLKSEFGFFPCQLRDHSQFPSDAVIFSQDGRPFGLPSYLFQRGLTWVKGAASTDLTKPILGGVFVELDQNHIEFAATDGVVVAVYRVAIQSETDELIQFVLPRSSIAAIEHLIDPGDAKEILKGFASRSSIYAWGTSYQVSSRVMGGQYVDYRRLFQPQYDHKIPFELDKYLSALRPLIKIADSGSGRILTTIDSAGFTFTANGAGKKSSVVTLPMQTGLTDEFKFVTFSGGLLKALNALKGKTTSLLFSRGSSRPLPVVFESTSGNATLKVLLSVLDPKAVRE